MIGYLIECEISRSIGEALSTDIRQYNLELVAYSFISTAEVYVNLSGGTDLLNLCFAVRGLIIFEDSFKPLFEFLRGHFPLFPGATSIPQRRPKSLIFLLPGLALTIT